MPELAISHLLTSSPLSISRPRSSRPTHLNNSAYLPFFPSGFFLFARLNPHTSSLHKDRIFRVKAEDPLSEFAEKWPEWDKLIEYLSGLGYLNSNSTEEEEDIFNFTEEISREFSEHSRACLMFAKERPDLLRVLPKRDIQVIVENVSPFLFKNAENSVRRMNALIGKKENDPSGAKEPYTVDLMKYLLSFAFDFHQRDGAGGQKTLAVSSSRRLFHELVKADSANGDRPNRQMTGREWECPQCEFFNNGRNSLCLRCDFPRSLKESSKVDASLISPEETSKISDSEISQRLDKILGRIRSPTAGDSPSPAASVSGKVTDGGVSDEDSDEFPGLMPARKGENRFVVSKKKDRSLTSPQYKRRIAMDQAASSNFVPFVPFPPGYFARNENQKKADDDNHRDGKSDINDRKTADDGEGGYLTGGDSDDDDDHGEEHRRGMKKRNAEGMGVKEYDPLDMSEEAKAQRWFRRVAQITDIEELSKIPDEDFPEIMPMRKGANRYVVSKRKTPLERKLSSQQRLDLPRKGLTSGGTFSGEELDKSL